MGQDGKRVESSGVETEAVKRAWSDVPAHERELIIAQLLVTVGNHIKRSMECKDLGLVLAANEHAQAAHDFNAACFVLGFDISERAP
jgi:hypothetical protein